MELINSITNFFSELGVFSLTWQMMVMWLIAAVLLYLGVAKEFEPLLLVPIAFGALMANIPDKGMLVTKVPTISVNAEGKEVARTETTYLTIDLSRPKSEESVTKAAPPEALWNPEAKRNWVWDHNDYILKDTEGNYVKADRVMETWRVDRIHGGLFDYIGQGIKSEIFPPIIFLGVGALTDFGPLIAAPRTLLLGAAAQIGVAATFVMALLLNFSPGQAASIGIIGGADGPTSIFLANKLAPELLGAIAVAAYTYMALVPLIQPPIMKLLTTSKQRKIRMKSLRQVSKTEKLVFCVIVTLVAILLVPDAAALIGMLMLGNFLRECKVTERLVMASQNEIINITTIFLGVSVGMTMQGERFLQTETAMIIGLGIIAFGVATGAGVICAHIMNFFWRKNPVNPLIGSAGVSAVPMAARVSHSVGQKEDPQNFLLMHAMGPNVAGVIGTAVLAGYYITTFAAK